MTENELREKRESIKKGYVQQQYTLMYTALLESQLLYDALKRLPEDMVLYSNVSDTGQVLPVMETKTVINRKKELESAISIIEARVGVMGEELLKMGW